MAAPQLSQQIQQLHQLYCQLTGQSLRLGFERERQWYQWLQAGFSGQDLRRVIAYLQREIRESRRNIGALKLSNLLQPDRFEEDLNIRQVRLRPQAPKPTPVALPVQPLSQAQLESKRQHCLERLRQIKATL